MAVSATAVGALAQVARNGGEESKQRALERLKAVAALVDDDPESGLSYVQEIARSHVEQLEGKSET